MIAMVGRAFVIGVLGVMIPDGAEVAVPAPLALRAVTCTRTRKPTWAARTPYVLPVAEGVRTSSMLTVGDAVGHYRMVGIPDGLGAYRVDGNSFKLLMNHELNDESGIVRRHGPDAT